MATYKRYKFLLLFLGIITFIILNGSCAKNPVADSEAGNPVVISTSALINLPSSISDVQKEGNLRSGIEAESIYNFIREQNYFVNELVNGEYLSIRQIINYIATFPWQHIKKVLEYTVNTDTTLFSASYSPTDSFPYKVNIENIIVGAESVIQAEFNGDSVNPKGFVYYSLANTLNPLTDSLKIKVTFNKYDSYRTLDIKIVQNLTIDTGDIAKSFIYSWYEKEGMIHMSGSSYHPFIKGILTDTVGYCYTYTAVVDTLKNRAVVKLAIPPGSYADSAHMFTTYGVADMFGKACINELKKPTTDDSIKMVIVTSYKDSLNLDTISYKLKNDTTFTLHDKSEIDSMTLSDLKSFLLINRKITNRELKLKYAIILWLIKLAQPVYFDERGYRGNGKHLIPSGFETIKDISCTRPVIIPKHVKELVIQSVYSGK